MCKPKFDEVCTWLIGLSSIDHQTFIKYFLDKNVGQIFSPRYFA